MSLRDFRAKERAPHAPYHLLALACPCLLLDKLCARGDANRWNGWMRNSPLNRNRVEALDDTVHNADRPSMILTTYFCLDDRWNWKQTRSSLAESLQQRTILELADDLPAVADERFPTGRIRDHRPAVKRRGFRDTAASPLEASHSSQRVLGAFLFHRASCSSALVQRTEPLPTRSRSHCRELPHRTFE